MVSSAAEAEVGALYYNARVALSLKQLLNAIGHPQPHSSLTTDDSTAHHFVYNNIHQKCSKSWNMIFFWPRDRINQKQFLIEWAEGKTYLADYNTKHHPIKHHKMVRLTYTIDYDPQTPNP